MVQSVPPVVVVGNINVGGTGKTPCVQALVGWFKAQGLQPGIISRGYGGAPATEPLSVTPDTPVTAAGDEAALLAQTCQCPVVVSANRLLALQTISQSHSVDVVISDDGLQHYRLPRTIEIVVIDGQRGLGNGHCLPVGPLREPADRLASVDFILQNGPGGLGRLPLTPFEFKLRPVCWVQVKSGQRFAVSELPADLHYHAIAGIGNPERFFATLRDLGLTISGTAFVDHHKYTQSDLTQFGQKPILMTAKDAVKCRSFARDNWWYLQVDAQLPDKFYHQLQARLSYCSNP